MHSSPLDLPAALVYIFFNFDQQWSPIITQRLLYLTAIKYNDMVENETKAMTAAKQLHN